MITFTRLSLVGQLLAGGAVILVAGMLVVGLWMSEDLERGHVDHVGLITGLYVDSFVAPHLQSLGNGGQLREADRFALDRLLADTPLGKEVLALKIWASDGRILYSTDPRLIGRQFPVKPALAAAFAGQVRTQLSGLTDPENELERQRSPRLIETYAPVRAANGGTILAVSEFYQTTRHLEQELHNARLRSWLMVSATTLVMFVLLAGLVRRASNTIIAQRNELQERVSELSRLLEQNERLGERVHRAAERTTALNERFLHRIAADLHDGPGQGLALALMRIQTLTDICGSCNAPVGKQNTVAEEFRTVHCALQSALRDLRGIAAGLRLPEIEPLSLAETARRAVSEFGRKTGMEVPLTLDSVPGHGPLPVKIAMYRFLQESLANGFRHGKGTHQHAIVSGLDRNLVVEVFDDGEGFDTATMFADGHLGLTGLRERMEILGGTFGVQSSPGKGTRVRASLPLAPSTEYHE
jgi:signal transduction histidine kinase